MLDRTIHIIKLLEPPKRPNPMGRVREAKPPLFNIPPISFEGEILSYYLTRVFKRDGVHLKLTSPAGTANIDWEATGGESVRTGFISFDC